MRTPIRTLVAIALLAGLSACGGSANPSADATQSTAKKSAGGHHAPAKPGELVPADMVSAVSPGKGGPPVELKFELRQAPQAGHDVEVDMAIVTDAPAINRLYAQFSGGEGIELVEGSNVPAIEKPAQGQVIRHVVRVLPQKDGIYTFNAAVTVDLADGSVTRTFTIPLIVGEGLADVSEGTAPKTR